MNRWLARALVLLLVLPVLASFAMTLTPAGLSEWAYWWRDARGWKIFATSIGFSAFGSAIALIFGAIVAFCLPRNRFISRVLLTFACLPILVPSSLMGVGWIMAMGADAVVTNLLRKLFGSHTPTIYAWPIAASATGLRYFGIAALILANVRISNASSRAAESVFTLTRRERFRLTLSALVAPLIATGGLLLILVFTDHILPGLFLIHTFGTEVLIQYNALMNPAGAATLALVPAVLSLFVAMLVLRLLGRRSWTLTRSEANETRSGRPWPIALLAIAVAVGIPLTGVIVRSTSWSNLATAFADARAEAVHSLWLSIIGAAFTVAISLPLASAARKALSIWSLLINLVVPGSLLALGLITIFSARPLQPIQDTEIPLILGYIARFTPVIVLVLFLAWLRIPSLSGLAARVHCASWVDRIVSIALPPRAPAIVVSLGLAALLIAAELDISLILVRPGPTTLGVRLYTLIHLAPDAVVSALAVDMLLLVIGIVIIFLALQALLRRSIR
jgi:iron(III) transport system permease protein